ncbi:siderophore-interacting protein [Labrenzia sp. CE80]|uniref:siderophore-interacting protein n=1 Tax=Labrenzia sp. CE80 TaxID=1788986 RepID=UPI00129B9F45|nr:siderophore-interacting protein [Labrenzia sp. CE80]
MLEKMTAVMPYQSTAKIDLPESDIILGQLVSHAREHDAVVRQSGPNDFSILVGESSINLASNDIGLTIEISAESESILYFLKEAAVSHLAELNADAAEAIRWDLSGQADRCSDLPPNLHVLSVCGKSEPTPSMIRLRLAGARPGSGLEGPGIHVKLMLPVCADREPVWPKVARNGATKWPVGEDALHVRYYTIKSYDPKIGEIEIDFVRHHGGVLSEWADKAEDGERIGLLGPGGGTEAPKSGARVVLAGDMTALPALARMIEILPDGTTGDLVGEAETIDVLQGYLPPTTLKLHALPPRSFQGSIVTYCRENVEQQLQFAWFAGEHSDAQAMRNFFKSELGLKKGAQYAISYWRTGKALGAG